MKNVKYLILIMSALWLSGCGGSSPGSSGGGTSGGINEGLANKAAKVVSISKVMPVPTEAGASKLAVRVSNFTGQELSFDDFKVHSQSSKTRVSATKSIANAGTCINGLKSQASCSIEAIPDAKDGSMVVEITFKDANNKKYTATQLLSYVSTVDEASGFGIAASNTTIHATNNPTITIPFINTHGYHDIKVSADHPLSTYVDCMNTIGAKCVARVTLQAAKPGTSYLNEIVIQGNDNQNLTHKASFMTRLIGDSSPSLAITAGPLVLDANKSNKATVFVVNTGETLFDLTNKSLVVHSHKDIVQWDNGASSIQAGTNGNSLLTLAQTHSANFITSEFTLPDEHSAKSGITLYEISYGIPGSNIQQKEYTQIYYKGLNSNNLEHNFEVSGLNFADTLADTTSVKSIVVRNTGKKPLGKPDFSILDPNAHTALAEDKLPRPNRCDAIIQLESGTSCNIYVTYNAAPAATGAAEVAIFEVKAKTLDSNNPIDLIRKSSIIYSTSATASPALQVSYPRGNTAAIGTNLNESASLSALVWNPATNAEFAVDAIVSNVSAKPVQSITVGGESSFNSLTAIGYVIDQLFQPMIKGGNMGVINYTYLVSDETKEEDVTLAYNILGHFVGATSLQDTPININLSTSANNVKTSVSYFLNGLPVNEQALNGFRLTHNTNLKMEVTYSATSEKDNFYILDSNLPYGFLLNTVSTTCPTTSSTGGSRPTGIVLGGTQYSFCKAVYDFMPTALSNQFFYGQAILGTSFIAPGYHYGNSTVGDITVQSNLAPIDIQPEKFVPVTTSVQDSTSVSGGKVVTVTVGNIGVPLTNAEVFVTPYSNSGATGVCNVSPGKSQNCIFNVTPIGGSNQLILNVKSGENGDYNTFDEVISWAP
jgi:hypothetical protein